MNRLSDQKPLSDFARDVTSYSGEDGILEELFRRIGASNKWCLEFGACEGKKGSNSWNLVNSLGWQAVLIEADHRMAAGLKRLYAGNERVTAIERFVRGSGPDSLDSILAATDIPHDPDLAIIDIDGHDYQMWASLKQYRPRAVMIEYNGSLGLELDWIQKDSGPLTGSSLSMLRRLGESMGYRLMYAKNGNAIFVDARSVKSLPPAHRDDIASEIPEYDIRIGRFVQANDGTVVLFDAPCPEAIERRSKIYRYNGPQLYISAGNEIRGIRPHSENGSVRRLKDWLRGTWFAKAAYPLVLKIYSAKKARNLRKR